MVIANVDGIGGATDEYTTPLDDLSTALIPEDIPWEEEVVVTPENDTVPFFE